MPIFSWQLSPLTTWRIHFIATSFLLQVFFFGIFGPYYWLYSHCLSEANPHSTAAQYPYLPLLYVTIGRCLLVITEFGSMAMVFTNVEFLSISYEDAWEGTVADRWLHETRLGQLLGLAWGMVSWYFDLGLLRDEDDEDE